MKTGWQLAIVDYDLLIEYMKHNNQYTAIDVVDEARRQSEHNSSFLKDGDAVFIAGVHWRCHANGQFGPGIEFVDRATVWIPRLKAYSTCIMRMLHPICTELDAVEMEMKFAIDLKEFLD